MKSTLWLGAAALAAIFATGCQDNQALGTERTKNQPDLPAANDPTVPNGSPPAREAVPLNGIDPMTQPRPGVDVAMKDTTNDNPSANEPTDTGYKSLETTPATNPVDSSKASFADSEPEVINGEDLANVPEQVGPLWNVDEGATKMNEFAPPAKPAPNGPYNPTMPR